MSLELTKSQKSELKTIGRIVSNTIQCYSTATPVGMPLDINNILESLVIQFSVESPWLSESVEKMRDIISPSIYRMKFLSALLEIHETISSVVSNLKINHTMTVRCKSLLSAIAKMAYNQYLKKDEIRDCLAGQIILGSPLQPQENLRELCYSVENITTEILAKHGFVPMILPVNARVGHYRESYCKDYNTNCKSNNYACLHSLYCNKEHSWYPVEMQFQGFPDYVCATYGSANHEGHKAKYKEIYETLGFDKLSTELNAKNANPTGIVDPTIVMSLNYN